MGRKFDFVVSDRDIKMLIGLPVVFGDLFPEILVRAKEKIEKKEEVDSVSNWAMEKINIAIQEYLSEKKHWGKSILFPPKQERWLKDFTRRAIFQLSN